MAGLKSHTAPTKSPTMIDIAWAAGLYEGEGHCGFTSKGTKGSAKAVISQKDPWVLEKMRPMFGGSVGKPTKHQACGHWVVFGARARGFLMTIYPYLSPRRKEQVKKVLFA